MFVLSWSSCLDYSNFNISLHSLTTFIQQDGHHLIFFSFVLTRLHSLNLFTSFSICYIQVPGSHLWNSSPLQPPGILCIYLILPSLAPSTPAVSWLHAFFITALVRLWTFMLISSMPTRISSSLNVTFFNKTFLQRSSPPELFPCIFFGLS